MPVLSRRAALKLGSAFSGLISVVVTPAFQSDS